MKRDDLERIEEHISKESRGFTKMKKRVFLSLIILVIALAVFTGYYLFYYIKPCKDNACYIDAIDKCSRVSWIREDVQASWLYRILGKGEIGACRIEVRLLRIKQGIINIEKLEGKGMVCNVLKGDTQFPEKDISRCSGLLKEELQDIIIQRMHNYLLENIKEITEVNFGNFSSS